MKTTNLLLLLGLGLTACTTTKNTVSSAPAWTKPYAFQASEPAKRQPSSTSEEIPGTRQVVWEANNSIRVTVDHDKPTKQNVQVGFTKYTTYQTRDSYPVTETRYREDWGMVTEDVLVCPESLGDGKSEYWNAFFSAPKSQKVARLNEAIQGIGDASAVNLLNAGYFNRKPRSWGEFEQEINSAANRGVITKSVQYQVLYKYRQDNMDRLGYQTQQSGYCHFEAVSHIALVQVPYPFTYIKTDIVNHRDPVGSDTRSYVIEVSGAKLLSYENENLVFSFNYDTNRVSLNGSYFNNYGIVVDRDHVTVKATSRKPVELPRDVLAGNAILESSNGMVNFRLPINAQFIPAANEGQLMVQMDIYSCKRGWVFNCKVLGNSEKKKERSELLPIKSNVFNFEFSGTAHMQYWVEYSLVIKGSPWYTDNSVNPGFVPKILL